MKRSQPMERKPFPRNKKKASTMAERAHMGLVADLGCIVCRNNGRGFVPAQVHHMKVNPLSGLHVGIGQRASHYHVLPLCPDHHLATSPVGYHHSTTSFVAANGTEIELYRQVCKLLSSAGYSAPNQL